MEITIKKKEACDLIEKYYRENKNIEAKVTIGVSREPVGIYETIECVTRVTVRKNIELLGTNGTSKEYLTEEMVLGIFRELLTGAGYDVISLSYASGINNVSVGYGMGEHTEYRPYFNGITLNVKENKNNKVLNR